MDRSEYAMGGGSYQTYMCRRWGGASFGMIVDLYLKLFTIFFSIDAISLQFHCNSTAAPLQFNAIPLQFIAILLQLHCSSMQFHCNSTAAPPYSRIFLFPFFSNSVADLKTLEFLFAKTSFC